MNSKTIVKLALSSAVIAVPSAGCTTLGVSSTKGMSSEEAQAKKADANARKAESRLANGQFDKAEQLAEKAVEMQMTNVDYRALLARVYMANGKFKSAERTLMDVMELGVNDPRTVVSLSLARIAQGDVNSAISLLNANSNSVSQSDMGLALALAGEKQRAESMLMAAARAPGATSRTRQNLALALALNGKWRDARAVASQDLSQTQVNTHIAQWAQYARPGAYQARVAGLLNVTPKLDAGQPVRLALANTVQGLASAAAKDTSPAQASSPVDLLPKQNKGELAAVGPAPVSTSVGFAAAEADTKVAAKPQMEAPLIRAPKTPVKAAVKKPAPIKQVAVPASKPVKVAAAPVKAKPAKKKPTKLAIANVKPRKASVAGTHIVQLGAFSSTANAKRAWAQYSSQYSVLNGFSSASSSVTVNGKRLIRLAAMGFGNKSAANSACKRIKAQGGSCIVRSVGKRAPVRLASR